MSKLTKEQALEKIEELKKYVDEVDTKVKKTVGVAIKSRYGNMDVIYQSTKTTPKGAVEEAVQSNADLRDASLSDANLSDADLRGANLRGADLSGADLSGAKFYGRGGSIVIKKKDLEGFLGALGFKVE